MESSVKISIIIPVYNVENFLEECIESVLNQTFLNFEAILVDDGSTDSSGEICDAYAKKDFRVKVIHKENGGLSSARNAGINIAQGEYFAFLDSDDVLHSDYLSVLYGLTLKHSADLVACDFIKGEQCFWETQNEKIDIRIGDEILLNMNINDVVVTVAWNKLYHNKFFREFGISFPEGKIYEDMSFTPQVLLHAQKMVLTNKKLYFYRQRSNSITTSNFSLKHLDIFDLLEFRIEFLKDNNFEELLCDEYQKYIRKLRVIYPKLKQNDTKLYSDILFKMRKKARKLLFDGNVFFRLNLKYKIKLLIFVIFGQ